MEVIAKIPCPNAGRAKYSTASEAAVLQYGTGSSPPRTRDKRLTSCINLVNSHTTIPTPKILAWSSDPSNPVGAEYIIMEKAPGIQLFKIWDDITEIDRLNLIKGLTQIEKQFADIKFPAYGCLYFRHSIPTASERVDLESSVDPAGLFCIGPECGPAWTNGSTSADIEPNMNAGPCRSFYRFVRSALIMNYDRAYPYGYGVRTKTEIACSDPCTSSNYNGPLNPW